jgi:hypothetical protein
MQRGEQPAAEEALRIPLGECLSDQMRNWLEGARRSLPRGEIARCKACGVEIALPLDDQPAFCSECVDQADPDGREDLYSEELGVGD